MTKTQTKFYFLSVLLLSVIIYIFFLLVYFVSFLDVAIFFKLLIWLFLSVVLAITISYAYIVTSSTISDAMTTLRRMSRVENLSHPLILRLSSEAPGTYHHSINVSNLAHKAAKAINADTLLARVSSYYHDIGKLSNPKVFIENQSGDEIPDEENSSWIRNNAKLIISHVEQGVKIAKDNNLPDDIVQVIGEHHGTTRALYFYEKAREHKLKIKKIDFSYHGPIPQSRESAIVMLCDCVEAAARAIQPINKDLINQLVNNTIEEKVKEGQLKRSNLNEEDLLKIKSSLVDTLINIYHQRISYKNNGEN